MFGELGDVIHLLVAVTVATAFLVVIVRSTRRQDRLLAEMIHGQVMDVAIHFRRMPPEDCCVYVRHAVIPAARHIMIRQHGAAYDDWLRSLYDRTLSLQSKKGGGAH